MNNIIKCLILEDSIYDAKLVQRELTKLNHTFETEVVNDKEHFKKTLRSFCPDLILSDFSLGQFNGLEALEIAKDVCSDIPFIVVTGSLSEETAVACMREGAWDYVLKDKLFKLEPAIESAFKMKNEMDAKKQIQLSLEKSESALQEAQKIARIGSWVFDINTKKLSWSLQMYSMLEVKTDLEPTFQLFYSRVHPEDLDYVQEIGAKVYESNRAAVADYRLLTPSGKVLFVHTEGHQILDSDKNVIKLTGIVQDISDRKQAELNLINAKLKAEESEKKYRLYFDNAPIGYQSLDENGCFLDVNNSWLSILGYSRKDVISNWFGDFLHPEQKEIFKKLFTENIKRKDVIKGVEFKLRKKNGNYILADYTASIQFDDEGNFIRTHCVFQDITERMQAEEELRSKITQLQKINNIMVGREITLNDTRIEVNELLKKLGEEQKYKTL